MALEAVNASRQERMCAPQLVKRQLKRTNILKSRRGFLPPPHNFHVTLQLHYAASLAAAAWNLNAHSSSPSAAVLREFAFLPFPGFQSARAGVHWPVGVRQVHAHQRGA